MVTIELTGRINENGELGFHPSQTTLHLETLSAPFP
jgi:hypothetical protein